VASGLTALARGGAFVVLAGPVLVTIWSIRHTPDRMRRWLHCAGALAVSTALASTWYVPNSGQFYAYVRQATYGQDAMARTGRAAALSWNAVTYYLTWVGAQGPGWPMLSLVIVGIGVKVVYARQRLRPSLVATAMLAVFVIDFAVLLLGMQRQTARYFLPLMPLVALGIVRIVQSVPHTAVRLTLATGIVFFAVHHVVALSIRMPAVHDYLAAPYVRGIPLWDHRTYFRMLIDFYKLRTPADDFRIAEIIRSLGALHIPRRAVIAVVGPPHAFFHRNGLQLESIQQQREWRWLPDVYVNDSESSLVTVPAADVVIVRGGPPTPVGIDGLIDRISGLRQQTRFGEVADFTLGDGSAAKIFVRVTVSSREEPRPGAPLPRYR